MRGMVSQARWYRPTLDGRLPLGGVPLALADMAAEGGNARSVQHDLNGVHVPTSVKNKEGGEEPSVLFPCAVGCTWAPSSALRHLDGDADFRPQPVDQFARAG